MRRIQTKLSNSIRHCLGPTTKYALTRLCILLVTSTQRLESAEIAITALVLYGGGGEARNVFLSNTALQNHVKHKTTWNGWRQDVASSKTVPVFNQLIIPSAGSSMQSY